MLDMMIAFIVLVVVGFLGYIAGYIDGHSTGIKEWKGPGSNVHF